MKVMTKVKCYRCKGLGKLVTKHSTMLCHSCKSTGFRFRIHKNYIRKNND